MHYFQWLSSVDLRTVMFEKNNYYPEQAFTSLAGSDETSIIFTKDISREVIKKTLQPWHNHLFTAVISAKDKKEIYEDEMEDPFDGDGDDDDEVEDDVVAYDDKLTHDNLHTFAGSTLQNNKKGEL